ncbi:MAG: CsbD family protein [Pyrinomonadaceae bacterium]
MEVKRIMGLPNNDEVEGKFDQAKGAIKENVGHAIGDKDMEAEGAVDRAGGNAQEGVGTARRKVGEAIEDVGNKIGR